MLGSEGTGSCECLGYLLTEQERHRALSVQDGAPHLKMVSEGNKMSAFISTHDGTPVSDFVLTTGGVLQRHLRVKDAALKPRAHTLHDQADV